MHAVNPAWVLFICILWTVWILGGRSRGWCNKGGLQPSALLHHLTTPASSNSSTSFTSWTWQFDFRSLPCPVRFRFVEHGFSSSFRSPCKCSERFANIFLRSIVQMQHGPPYLRSKNQIKSTGRWSTRRWSFSVHGNNLYPIHREGAMWQASAVQCSVRKNKGLSNS